MSEVDDLFKKHYKDPYAAKPTTPAVDAAKKDGEKLGILDSIMQPVSTFSRNALNKATFGLADHAASYLRGTSVEDERKKGADMRARDPWSATAGDVAGLAAQQVPVARGLALGTGAIRAAVPLAGAVNRAITGGGVVQGILGQGLVGGTTAGINAATDNAWGEGAGKRDAMDTIKEIGLGAAGGAVGGGIGNALFGGAINRAGTQIPSGILADAKAAADPAKMAKFGLTGKAAPNAEQALRMAGGEAADRFAPAVGEIFEKAGSRSTDSMFPALRTNAAAQFPKKTADDYTGSFAQMADSAKRSAALAEKGIAKGASTKPIRAASFLDQETREASKLARDAAVNKKAANPKIPHAFESRFLDEAADLATNPASANAAKAAMGRAEQTLARRTEKRDLGREFADMREKLQAGPRNHSPPQPTSPNVTVNNNLIPFLPEIVNGLKGLGKNRPYNQAFEAAEGLASDPFKNLAAMGRRSGGQEAAGLLGYPGGELIFENLIRKLQLAPSAGDIRR
jgi:hypothetical protein